MASYSEARSLHQRMVDLSVGRKLFLGFSALTVVLALVIGSLFLALARLGEANDFVVEVSSARARSADQLRFAAAELRAAQQAFVLDPTTSRTAFNQAASRFEGSLDELREGGGDQVETALIQKIATGYQTFLATDQMITAALQDGETDLARNLTLGAESLAFGFMADDAATFADQAEADRLAAVDQFDETSSDARTLGIVLGAAALLVMVVASWLITRLIRDPLHRVQQAAERAADGDLDASADVDGNDETGRLAAAFNSMLSKLRLREQALLADHHRQEVASKVHRALEMSDDEATALEVVGMTMANVLPERSSELLLADNSKANLEQAVVAGPNPDGPGCPVASPFSCVAVRSGAPVTFPSSTALDACPHLRNRGVEPCSAVCVPVTFMGRAMGVIHAVGEENAVPVASEIEALSMLSTQAGARIGMLRTMVRTQVQASTDSLTGIMNRRTFQTRIRTLRRADTPFAFVMADIDHFKRVNDTYGHETGDRAIKTFVEVAKATVRQSDVIARWGGEEFAFAFPNLDPVEARDVIDRMRLELAGRLSTSDLPGFTVSFGIVAADECLSLEDAVRFADDALYEAKALGRNCSVIASTEARPEPTATAAPMVRVAEKVRSNRDGVLASLARDDDPQDA
ncbi:MAG: diguanylate cyclase [Actinomycetota bacterium]